MDGSFGCSSKQDDGCFDANVQALLLPCFPATTCHDQKECMHNVQKPFKMTCLQVARQLRVIDHLAEHPPGSAGQASFVTENELEHACFGMMVNQSKIQFAQAGHGLDASAHSLNNLVCFMTVQQQVSNAHQGKNQDGVERHEAQVICLLFLIIFLNLFQGWLLNLISFGPKTRKKNFMANKMTKGILKKIAKRQLLRRLQ